LLREALGGGRRHFGRALSSRAWSTGAGPERRHRAPCRGVLSRRARSVVFSDHGSINSHVRGRTVRHQPRPGERANAPKHARALLAHGRTAVNRASSESRYRSRRVLRATHARRVTRELGANKNFNNTDSCADARRCSCADARRWAYTSRMWCDVAQCHPYEFTN
jgi:hypothetical protein